jgi:AraC-like DNA-binding protein
MQYREIKPGPAVRTFIRCFWVLEDDSPESHSQTIVPDGRAELIINLGLPFEQANKGNWHTQPDVFFVGQITGPFTVRPQGPARTIGVRFRPEGAGRFFRLPMFELTDAAVAVDQISQKLHRHLERLRELPALPDQLSELEQIFLRGLDDNEEDKLISAAVNWFEQAHGLVSIRELSERLGLSARQLERRFRHAVGISPKLFCRMQRFQQVFQSMEGANSNWVETAVNCGYYDQAHLIRDFREFSGATPTALLDKEFDLTRHFARHQMSLFSNTSAVILR